MERPDFSAILDAKPKSVRYIDPGYLNANSVWEVATEADRFIVKISRLAMEPEGAFWNGLKYLFDSYPYLDMDNFETLTNFVRLHSELNVPRIKRIDTSMNRLPQKYMIVEYLDGKSPVKGKITPQLAAQFGAYLGRLHKASFSNWGNFYRNNRLDPCLWGKRLSDCLGFIASGWFAHNDLVQSELPFFQNLAQDMPYPETFSLIMPDLFWSQFLEFGGNLSAVVDIEALVIGPRELDLVACEYLFDHRLISSFVEGYRGHLPIPDLQAVRSLYRFLYYLMEVEETYSFEQWMNYPALLGG